MEILIIGASGLVGSDLVDRLSSLSSTNLLTPDHQQLDLISEGQIESYFQTYQPEIVINYAAFTNVTKAESERGDQSGEVWRLNVEGPVNLAQVCKKWQSFLIQISTDGVFSGQKENPGPYSENDLPTDDPNQLSWYGYTKRIVEQRILDTVEATILRISNPTRTHFPAKLDYVRKFLWLYKQNRLYPVFNDQFFSLSYIPDVSQTVEKLITKRQSGIFHCSSPDLFVPFELAEYLFKKAFGIDSVVESASLSDYLVTHPNRYPQFGGLKVEKTMQQLGINFKTWREVVDLVAKESVRVS